MYFCPKMIKTSVKYLLSLCIIVLSGHSSLYANVSCNVIPYSSINPLAGSVHSGFGMIQNSLSCVIKGVSSDTEKENDDQFLVVFDDDDDDDVASFKKHVENHTCLISTLFGQIPGCFLNCTENTIPSSTYFSPISSCRYLVLQVFRL